MCYFECCEGCDSVKYYVNKVQFVACFVHLVLVKFLR